VLAPPPLVEIDHATVVVGTTTVFDDLSLTLPTGTSTAILGPNGAGKTTLLRLLARDLYPTFRPQTRMRILGRERWNVFDLRSRMGLVSHELQLRHLALGSGRGPSGLDVALSGFHSSVGLWPHQRVTAEQERRGHAWLSRLGVAHLAKRAIGAISAGEQRRCLLARALVHEPHTLVLDEPSVSLDLKASHELLALLRTLAAGGRTLVLVTHHPAEILPEISRVLLLDAGRIVAQGAKEEVLTSSLLSELYGVRLRVVQAGGFFQVVPAA
jgi:iron complex transport system ATP-binding protein